MKTIIIGDVHGTTHWKDILDFENPNRVIFIGDYFDGYDNNVNEIQNFKNIIQYKNYNVCEGYIKKRYLCCFLEIQAI